MASSRIKANVSALLIGLAVALTGPAQASPPVVHVHEGTQESPATAAAAVSATSTSMWTLNTAHPEVIALARSLNSDPTKTADRIYEYVRNTVETLPMHGLKKGAMGAIIDKKGTALDQAVLMADLLHAAGKTNAKVHLVELQLSFAEFDAWHGAGNAGDICRLLKAGGIPFDFVGGSFAGDCAVTTGATDVKLMHAVVGYGNKFYDPAYKTQTHIAGIDLGAAMGFNLGNLQSDANFVRNTKNGVPYVNGSAVPAAVEGELQDRAEQLVRTLRDRNTADTDYVTTENYKLSTTDVVGGIEIAAATNVEGSGYGTSSITGDYSDLSKNYGQISGQFRMAIPDDLRTTITISHNGGSFSARLDELYGFRLWFKEVGANMSFVVGRRTVWDQAYSSSQTVDVSISHPYSGLSGDHTEAFNPPFTVGDSAALIFTTGNTGLGVLGRALDFSYQILHESTSGTVAGSTLESVAQLAIAGSYVTQQSQLAEMVEGVTGARVLSHDFVGIIAGNNTGTIDPHFDVRGQISVIVDGGAANKTKAATATLTSAMSVLEASVADQASNIETSDAKSRSGASLMAKAISGGYTLYGVVEDDFNNVENELYSYSTAVLDRLYDDVPTTPTGYNTTHDIVLPTNGALTVENGITINAYVAIDPTTGAIGYLVDDSTFSSKTSLKGTFSSDISSEGAISTSTDALLAVAGLDPSVVPSATGAGFGGTDLVAGSGAFPYALPFRRSFSGGASAARGWTHNYDIDARYGANGMIGLGMRKPVEAASVISALYSNYKYLEDCIGAATCSTAEQVAISAISANWLQDALIDNALNVRYGHSFTTYAKLATGELYAPSGESRTVTETATQITIEELNGRQTIFSVDSTDDRFFLVDKMTWPTGMEVDFTVTTSTGGSNTVVVTNSLGRSLNIVRQVLLTGRVYRNITATTDQGVVATLTELGLSTNPAVPYTNATVNGVNVANYYFNGAGLITSVRTPEYSNKVLYTYNALGQMETSTLADRDIYSALYRNDWRSETAQLKVSDDAFVSSGVSVSDPYGRYSVGIDALGNQARTSYDRLGRVVESRSPKDANRDDSYATVTYDRFHNRLSSTGYSKPDANSSNIREALTTTFVYYGTDKYRQLHTVTDPLSRVTTLDYFTNTETLVSGKRGQLKTQTLPSVAVAGGGSVAPVTTFAYTTNGLTDTVTAPDGTVTSFAYTGGLPTTVTADAGTGGVGLATNFTYYLNGDLKTVQDHRTGGAITTYDYDALRRQERVSAPGTSFSEVEYDGDGRVTANRLCVEGAATCTGSNILQQTTRTFDGAGRVLTVTDNASNTSSVVYDDITRTITVTDPRGVKQQRLFDVLGRAVQTTHNHEPAAGTSTIVERVAFLQDGNLDYVEDGRDTKTYYNYDHFNRVTKTNYVGGSSEEITGYDTIGRPTDLKSRAGDTVELTYNNLDWVTQRKITRLVGGAVVTYDFTYDIMGRVKTVTHADTSTTNPAQTVTYSYDSLGRPTDEVGANGLQAGYAYDDALGETTLYYGDRTNSGTYNVTYKTDALGRLSGIEDTSSIAAYTYDAQSRVDQITFGNGTSQSLTYETDTGWLNSLSLDAVGTGDDVTFTYTRDDEGRITNEHISNDSYMFKQHSVTPQSISYLANAENQYTIPADILHVYDGNGNLTDDGDYTYAYDGENRLTEARKYTVGTSTMLVGEYSYDALGRRSEKKVTAGNITTRYMYAGSQVLAEYNQSNVMQRRYVYGPGIDNPLMVEEADGTRHYLHRDGKGSIMAASYGNGTDLGEVAFKFTADAWGYGADETTSPYRFTARRMDEETGNYYYRNRYYHPDSGRFMSNDPIGYGDGLNMYAYAYNDPVNFRDPMGLSGDCIPGDSKDKAETQICGSGKSNRGSGSRVGNSRGVHTSGNTGFANFVRGGFSGLSATGSGSTGDSFVSPGKTEEEKKQDLEIAGEIEEIVATAKRAVGDGTRHLLGVLFFDLKFALFQSFLDRTFFGATPEERPYFLSRPDGDIEGSLRRRFGLDSGGVEDDHTLLAIALPAYRYGRAALGALGRSLGPRGNIFGREHLGGSSIGNLNSNGFLRAGWGWKARVGGNIIRLSPGKWLQRNLGLPKHIDIPWIVVRY